MPTYIPYLLSLVVGLGIGAIYGLLAIKSPAPPIIALIGLMGILVGEATVQWLRGHKDVVQSCLHEKSFSTAARPHDATDPKNI